MIKTAVIRIAGIALTYYATLLVANKLGAEQYGIYSSIMSFSTICAVISAVGMPLFVIKTLTNKPIDDLADPIPKKIALTLSTGIFGGLTVIVLVTMLVLFGIFSGYEGAKYRVLYYSLYIFPPLILVHIRQGIALVLKDASSAIFPEQILLNSMFISIITLSGRSMGSSGIGFIIGGYATCALIALIIGLGIFNKKLLSDVTIVNINIKENIEYATRGIPFMVSKLATILISNLDILIVSYLIGFRIGGYYAAASRIAALVAMPLGLLSMIFTPRAAKLYSMNKIKMLNHEVRYSCTRSFVMSVFALIVILLFYKKILDIMGHEFLAASSLVLVLVVGQVFNSFFGPNAQLMQMIGMENIYTRLMLLMALIQGMASIIFAHYYGSVMLVAIAVIIVSLLWNIVLTVFINRKTGIIALPYKPILCIRHLSRIFTYY